MRCLYTCPQRSHSCRSAGTSSSPLLTLCLLICKRINKVPVRCGETLKANDNNNNDIYKNNNNCNNINGDNKQQHVWTRTHDDTQPANTPVIVPSHYGQQLAPRSVPSGTPLCLGRYPTTVSRVTTQGYW